MWATIAGVGVGIGGLGFIWKQARATEKSTQAAIKAAKAAADNAIAVINAERPWIIGLEAEGSFRLFGNPTVIPQFTLKLKNCGRTPGKVTRVLMKFQKRETLADLSSDPLKELAIASICELHNLIVIPGEPSTILYETIGGNKPLTQDETIAIRDGSLVLWVHGVIEYADTFNDGCHYSRFCFVYGYRSAANHGFEICFTAPPSYREIT